MGHREEEGWQKAYNLATGGCLWPCVPCPLSTGKSKEAEIKRINKELANIRSKFKGKLLPGREGCRAQGA